MSDKNAIKSVLCHIEVNIFVVPVEENEDLEGTWSCNYQTQVGDTEEFVLLNMKSSKTIFNSLVSVTEKFKSCLHRLIQLKFIIFANYSLLKK